MLSQLKVCLTGTFLLLALLPAVGGCEEHWPLPHSPQPPLQLRTGHCTLLLMCLNPSRHIRFWVWFSKVCYIIFDILISLMPSLWHIRIRNVCVGTATCIVGDSHVLGVSLALVHRALWAHRDSHSAFAGCLSLDLGSSNTERQGTLWGNANQRIVPTKVRSCTESSVMKSNTVQASAAGTARLTWTCNFYKSQSSSSTWVAHHICTTHTLEISEKIQATVQFQLKAAQAKTNVMISGLNELRLQQWDLERDQPTSSDASVDRSSRPIHLLPQETPFWSDWGTLAPAAPRARSFHWCYLTLHLWVSKYRLVCHSLCGSRQKHRNSEKSIPPAQKGN